VARNPGVVELVGVCDLDERRATEYASRFGFAGVHTDLDRLLDEGLDGLVAITPMDLTESVATKALEAGSPWSSKNHPVSALKARSDCSASQDRRGQNNGLLQSPFCATSDASPWVDGCRETWGEAHRFPNPTPGSPGVGLCPRYRATSGGCVFVDILGNPARVIGHREFPNRSRAANYTARIETASGITAGVIQTPDVGVSEESIEILGDGFRVCIEFQHGTLRIDADGEQVLTWSAAETGTDLHEKNGAYDETAAFVTGLQPGATLSPTMEEGIATMHAIVAMQQGQTWEA
jgi:predicted dehydrogenase